MQEHTIAVGSSLWWQWIAAEGTTTFRFEHRLGNFTARRERKRDGSYWYAYRTRDGALQKGYLGKSADLSLDRLQRVAAILAAPATHAGDPVPSMAESAPPAAARFPTGTVTFLFTDIEGSTTLWEQQPQAMSSALARHDALLLGDDARPDAAYSQLALSELGPEQLAARAGADIPAQAGFCQPERAG